ncbi:hypothetical protein L6452_19943 [Arctium lappa]|uniref:Uncharacterized protein n=1 Tax=Arctium lappa TaxID=4217 RepID=A0ACB9BAC6_ARCLA|nr:hypothetical protein L6452_19943 [Arctium lappa]
MCVRHLLEFLQYDFGMPFLASCYICASLTWSFMFHQVQYFCESGSLRAMVPMSHELGHQTLLHIRPKFADLLTTATLFCGWYF